MSTIVCARCNGIVVPRRIVGDYCNSCAVIIIDQLQAELDKAKKCLKCMKRRNKGLCRDINEIRAENKRLKDKLREIKNCPHKCYSCELESEVK